MTPPPAQKRRILHVGWGFLPWRPGGLIAYAEDLMQAQVERGDEVSYFLSGRHYPLISGPRLKRWRRRGVAMYEVVNPPIVGGMEDGTRRPELELEEPGVEAAFRRVLGEVAPDVVHIQELHGLPSSLIEVAGAAGVPTLMTLQDYFPLCATLRLSDADGRVCMRRDVRADCVLRNAAAPSGPGRLVAETLGFEVERAGEALGLGRTGRARAGLVARRLYRLAAPDPAAPRPTAADADGALGAAFQRRRDVNVERLGRVDRLVAPSPRVAEIYRTLGVSGERMSVVPFTLKHIDRLRPRELSAPPRPVTFGTLNGCASRTKGVGVVVGALRELRAAGAEGRFRLRVFGYVDRAARDELERFEGVELHGPYEHRELDSLLDDVDVGLMPSIWEEAFPFAGVELVSKGLPLIANPLGGMVEYAREGQTAWLNRSCSGAGLAELMLALVREPERVVDMQRRLRAVLDELFVDWRGHVEAIDAVYPV